jgi:CBS domain containing-hemolysin-like protein
MVELIIAVSFAIIVSAGCSLFEAVLYSVPLRHLETMVQKNRPSAKILKELRGNVMRPISAILSLNTIANTAGAAFAGSAAAVVFGHRWLGYFSAFFTLAILIFSEVIPKWFMTPAIWLCSHVTKLVARKKTQDSISTDELITMARLSLLSGGIKHYQESVIGNILTLDTRTVKDVMTPRTVIFSLDEHLTLEEASKQSTKWEHSRFPVYDKDVEDIVGIVLTIELFMALSAGKKETRLTELMRPVRFVVETARLSNVLMEFTGSREKLFVVIDEYGGVSGLITLEDVLEEILGREIVDESDEVADKRLLARQRRAKIVSRLPRGS